MAPVATFKGKLSGDASGRPEASWNPAGSAIVKGVCSAKGGGKLAESTTASSSFEVFSSPNFGLIVLPPPCSAICAASLRATGELNCSTSGFSGRQAACAFSRSQLKETAKGSRTSKFRRRSTVLATPEGVVTPLP
jgi:hypothetical protein